MPGCSVLYSGAPAFTQRNASLWVRFPDQQGKVDLVSKPAFFESLILKESSNTIENNWTKDNSEQVNVVQTVR